MYKKIVIGYDESDISRNALSEVSNRVRQNGSHITLVHAVYHDSEEFDISRGQLEQRISIGKDVCVKTAEEFNAEYGVNIDTVVCEGEPDKVIVDVAGGMHADMIALGTHGRKGIKNLLMGSVTSGVIEKSPCDVLVVRKPCPSGCSGGYKSILVAYDGSEYSKKALERAVKLADGGQHEITMMYVIPSYQEMVGFYKTQGIKDAMYDEANKVLDGAGVKSNGSGNPIGKVVQEGHAASKIVEMATKLKSDLIVMGSHGWTGVDKAIMGSTTHGVIVGAPCPVLVVR